MQEAIQLFSFYDPQQRSDFDSQMFLDDYNIAVTSSFDGLHLSSALQVLSLNATFITLIKISLLKYI